MKLVKIVILVGILSLGVGIVSAAWTSAPATPPSGNPDAPLNVGVDTQTKRGQLFVNGDGTWDIGAVITRGLKTTSTVPNDTRIYIDDEAPVTANTYSGIELRKTNTFYGGLFRKDSTNEIQIWKNNAAVISVGQDGKTTFSGAVKIAGGSPGVNKVLTSDEDGDATWQEAGSSQPHGIVLLGTPGSNNWTVPSGVTSIDVEVVGGGGGGAYHGGAGGGYVYKRMAVTPGQSIPYVVGAGGNGAGNDGSCSQNGGYKGGDSSFNTTVIAYGGEAGGENKERLGGAYSGGDYGAYGKDSYANPYNNDEGPGPNDRPTGYPSGFPYSTGSYAKDPNGGPYREATYGGGGQGDTDSGGGPGAGYCGTDGADGIIIIKY